MDSYRLTRFDDSRDDGGLELQQFVAGNDLFVWVRIRRRAIIGPDLAFRLGDFGSRKRDRQRDGSFSSFAYVGDGLVDPVVKWVRLYLAGSVLLNAPSPDVLVGILLQCGGPIVSGLIKISSATMRTVVAHAIRDSQPKLQLGTLRELLQGCLIIANCILLGGTMSHHGLPKQDVIGASDELTEMRVGYVRRVVFGIGCRRLF